MTQFATFAQWLRSCRKARGLTQEELADHIGCSPETVRKIEAGRRKPSRHVAQLLAQYLGVPREEEEAWMRLARTGQEAEAEGPADAELPHLRTIRAETTRVPAASQA